MNNLLEQYIALFGRERGVEGETWLFECPECKHTLRAHNTKGLYHCFNCGFGKGKRIEGKFTFTQITKKPSFNPAIKDVSQFIADNLILRERHKTALYKRAIYNPSFFKIGTIDLLLIKRLIDRFGKDFLTECEVIKNEKVSFTLDPGRVFIPYYHKGEIINFKTRESFDDVGSYKYMSLSNSGIGSKIFSFSKPSSDIFVTEGELKAMAAKEAGFNCYASPGIAFSDSIINQFRSLFTHPQVKRIFIVLDNSAEELSFGMKKAQQILLNLKPSKTCLVNLPTKKTKIDLDEFLYLEGPDCFEDVCEHEWVKKIKGRN